jgi:4a-hydroxytetrahydrobiopterin dehydratase
MDADKSPAADGTTGTAARMAPIESTVLCSRRCVPCEGGVPAYSREDSLAQLERLTGWSLTADGQRIRKEWRMRDFLDAMRFFARVAELAEEEQHHPDLHLVAYRQVAIEIWTHAIGGLSENDFILAAKIDALPR